MMKPRMRLKADVDRGRYSSEFLRDLDVKGWLYVYTMADYDNWKGTRRNNFKTERMSESTVDWWNHTNTQDWEELPAIMLPPELFELD